MTTRTGDPRWIVEMSPEILGTHQWSFFAAMSELLRSGEIELCFRTLRPTPLRAGCLTRVTENSTGAVRLVAWEMHDTPELDTWNSANSDIIFKRSFDERLRADGTYGSANSAVRPMGLTIGCTAPGVTTLAAISNAKLAWSAMRRSHRIPVSQLGASVRATIASAWSGATGTAIQSVQEPLAFYESFQRAQVDTPRVTFLVRAWDPAERSGSLRDEFEATSHERAEMIRQLRSALGPRFVGGFVPTEHSRREFPDCIAEVPTGRRDFVAQFARGGIAVSVRGLADSNPWKLAEYPATGTAVISEPLRRTIPEPFVENESILTFDTPDGCVAHCLSLLTDQDRTEEMRMASQEFWRRYVRPDALVRNRLAEAFA